MDDHRFGDDVEHLGGDEGGALLGPGVGEQHQKFVAADPSDRVAGADDGAKPPGDFRQDLVACGVAERVVGKLEPVEVEKENGQPAVPPASAFDSYRQPVLKQAPVGKARQFVVAGRGRFRFFRESSAGDVEGVVRGPVAVAGGVHAADELDGNLPAVLRLDERVFSFGHKHESPRSCPKRSNTFFHSG